MSMLFIVFVSTLITLLLLHCFYICSLYINIARPERLPDLGLPGVCQIMFSLSNSYCKLVFVLVQSGALLGQKESSDSQLQTESHHCPTWTHFNDETFDYTLHYSPYIANIITHSKITYYARVIHF